jgi:hypothetical protein
MKKQPTKTKEKIKAKPANQRTFKEKTLLKKLAAEEKGVEVKPVSIDSFPVPAPEKNKGGRPSSFDQAAPKIILCLRNGNTYECAAGVARISYGTLNAWKKQGEEDLANGLETKFSKFLNDVHEAERACEEEVLGYWKKEMPGNWQAAKDFLARRHHKEWGSKDKVDVTSNGETVGKPFFMPMKDEEEE